MKTEPLVKVQKTFELNKTTFEEYWSVGFYRKGQTFGQQSRIEVGDPHKMIDRFNLNTFLSEDDDLNEQKINVHIIS
jgi:hypothetical protein